MSNATIPLARVILREAISCPGPTVQGKMFATSGQERVLISHHIAKVVGVAQRQTYDLGLDPRTGFIVVKDPVSGEEEEVPMSLVLQVRKLKREETRAKAVGE